jgi:hypothetical protein
MESAEEQIQILTEKVNLLEHKLESIMEERLGLQEDIHAIEKLQYCYGYYIDMLLYDEMTELFASNGAIEIGQRGRYIGKENVRRFLFEVLGTGEAGLHPNQIINHTQHQGIISVDPDRRTAKGRFRAIIQASGAAPVNGEESNTQQGALMWSDGVYENQYVREDGVWKIALLWWSPTFYVTHPYEKLWFDSTPESTLFPPQQKSYPKNSSLGREFVPYHYLHPVTGNKITEKVID